MGFTIIHGAAGSALGSSLGAAGEAMLAGKQQQNRNALTQSELAKNQQEIATAKFALEEHEQQRLARKQLAEAQAEIGSYDIGDNKPSAGSAPALPQGVQGPVIHPGTMAPDYRDQATLSDRMDKVKILGERMTSPEAKAAWYTDQGAHIKDLIAKNQYHDSVDAMHDSWVKMAQTPLGKEQAPLVEQMFKMLDLAADADPEARLRLLGDVTREFGRIQVAGAKQHQQQLTFEETTKALTGMLGQAQPGSKAAGKLSGTLAMYMQGLIPERTALRMAATAHLDSVPIEISPGVTVELDPDDAAKFYTSRNQEAGRNQRNADTLANRTEGIELTQGGLNERADKANETKLKIGAGRLAALEKSGISSDAITKRMATLQQANLTADKPKNSTEIREDAIAQLQDEKRLGKNGTAAPAVAPTAPQKPSAMPQAEWDALKPEEQAIVGG